MLSTILLAPPAEQQLRTLDKPLRKALAKWLQTIKHQPRCPNAKKLEGLDHLYRMRDGDYRILYAIRDQNLLVLAIKQRAPTPRTPKRRALPIAIEGQTNVDRGPEARLTLDGNRSLVGADHILHNLCAEPGSPGFPADHLAGE